MKIVHAADLHLDSPLRGLAHYEGAPTAQIRAATRRALASLVELCVEEQAALLLISGDLYDGDFRDYSTALYFTDQMARLKEAGTQVVWLRGNHDAQNRITRHLRSASHVTELSTASPQTVCFEELGVAIHGQGYATGDLRENLARNYPAPLSGLLNVGMLHTALDGREGHAPYAPCSLSDLTSLGYDYWALGHVHQREILCEAPWVVFPGNLQGRHIRETGPKGATVINVNLGQITSVEARALDHVRFGLVELSACGMHTMADVFDQACLGLRRLREESEGRTIAARVRIIGASSVHHVLSSDRTALLNELRAYAVDQGDMYLERVQLSTVARMTAEGFAARHDALGEMFQELTLLQEDEESRQELWAEVLKPLSPAAVELLRDPSLSQREILLEAVSLLQGRLFSESGGEKEA